MNINYDGDRAIISGEYINPFVVFDCGQTFRFERCGETMSGIAMGKRITLRNTDDGLEIYPTTEVEISNIWSDYFDLDFSYSDLERGFARDEVLSATLECCRGMRLLNQDPFETIISFLISQNNHIPRIKKIISALCREFGTRIGEDDFAFPTVEQLCRATEDDLLKLGTGYRAGYISKSTRMLADMDLNELFDLSYDYAKCELLKLVGVGPKVADCILLFAFKKKNAFPKDVWIKRVLNEYYGFVPKNDAQLTEFVLKTFGQYAGIAQQYLFHYIRMQNGIKPQ